MTLGIGLESSRESKGFRGIFFWDIYHLSWLDKKVFWQSLVQEKFSLLLLHFGATKISKFVLQVSNVSSLDIWGFLWFVLGDLVHFFCEVFSSCDLHLGVFVRLMPFFGNFLNSFGDSGRN